MLCNREFVKTQVRRLSGLEFFPIVAEAANELVNALATAPDEDAAGHFIDEWIQANVRAPRPAEIYGAFKSGAFKPATEVHCQICGDTRWVMVERGLNTGADMCVCHPGRRETIQ